MKKILLSLLALLISCGLAWADGFKVSGTVTLPAGLMGLNNGHAVLLDAQGAFVARTNVVIDWGSADNNWAMTVSYEFPNVTDGTYSIRVAGSQNNNEGKTVVYSGTESNVEVSADITKDVTLAEDADHALLKVTPQVKPGMYWEDAYGVTISCQKKDDAYKETCTNAAASEDGESVVAFYCDKTGTYTVTAKKAGYQETSKETTAWANDKAVSLDIEMEEGQGEEETDEKVSLSGNVTFAPFTDLSAMTEKLKLTYDGLETAFESAVTNGQYTFTDVPKRAGLTLSIISPYTDFYGNAETTTLLQVKSPTNGAIDLSSIEGTTATQAVELERIAVQVVGHVQDAAGGGLGYVNVQIGNETQQTVDWLPEGSSAQKGDFLFAAVSGTQLSVKISMAGYADVTKDTTIDYTKVRLDGKVDLGTIVMTPQKKDYTFTGKVGLKKDEASEPEFLSGATVELWTATGMGNDRFEKGAKLTEATTDAMGAFSLTYNGIDIDYLCIVANHSRFNNPVEKAGYAKNLAETEGGIVLYGTPKLPGMENCKAEQLSDTKKPEVKLSWEWPAALRDNYYDEENNTEGYYLSSISVYRKAGEAEEQQVGYLYGSLIDSTYFVDSAAAKPLEVGKTYTYRFEISYTIPSGEKVAVEDPDHLTVTITADKLTESVKVTLKANNDEWGTVEGPDECIKGSEVTIKATAKDGYEFKAWQDKAGAEISKLAEYKFVVDRDTVLTAVFAEMEPPVTPEVKVKVTLKANNDEWGTVEGPDECIKGSEVTIKATAKDGYKFKAWQDKAGAEISKTAEYKFVVDRDTVLTAVFVDLTANEYPEQAVWNVYVENGQIVLRGTDACRYEVYTISGTLLGQVRENGSECRITVDHSGLYIIRRISSTGISVKKVVVGR